MKKILLFIVFTLLISLSLSFANATDKSNNVKASVKEKSKTVTKQISEKRAVLKIKYKTTLKRNLQTKLSKIPQKKLEVLLSRINTLSNQIEVSKYTQIKKDKLLAQLDALKELVEETIRDEGAVL